MSPPENPFAGLQVPVELLEKYDRPGPRYTSYPTAPVWSEEFGPAAQEAALRGLPEGRGLSLYLHLPFCAERCSFCGCSVIITPKRSLAGPYVDRILAEMELVAARLPGLPSRPVRQIHWGGGTPTFLDADGIRRLGEGTARIFAVAEDAEVSVEVDPRVTTAEQLEALRAAGFNRLSMGIQDFDPRVQEAVRRIQPEEMTRALFEEGRRLGFESINVDLIYGLPFQTRESFAMSVERILDMGPDRIALFSYAHVPWIKPHQTRFSDEDLPAGAAKFAIFREALGALTGDGYEFIGLDHFARPDDELARQRREGGLHRNFQGYSTHGGLDLIGFGVTAISGFERSYAQNLKKLSEYYRRVEGGGLATLRGIRLGDEDLLRRRVISDLMCHSRLDFRAIEGDFGVRFESHFAPELEELRGLERDGLLALSSESIEGTALGRIFIRNICMVFDEHLQRPADTPGSPVYSRTI
ncbi:MAG: oxygen-independent coproporphyrinogen III oxidase [Planctomycetota bacterium]